MAASGFDVDAELDQFRARGLRPAALVPWAAACAGVGFSLYLYAVPYQRQNEVLARRSADLAAERAAVQEVTKDRDRLRAEAAKVTVSPDRVLRLAKFQSIQAVLGEKLKRDLASHAGDVRATGDRILIRFPESAIFEGRGADLSEGGEKALDALGAALRDQQSVRVLVIAYLDGAPVPKEIQDLFPSSWELSAGRATNAVRYAVESGGAPAGLLLAVAGGDATGARAAGGRRLEIEIVPE